MMRTKRLLTASSLEVKDSTFSAKGLQINPTDAASGVNLAVTGGANLTLVGGDTVGSSVIIDESGSAVKTQIEIDGGATLNLGIAGNTANQMASLDSLDVRNGTVNVNGNGLDTTQHTYGELAVSHEDAAVNFSKATVVAQKTTLGAGSVSVTDNTAAPICGTGGSKRIASDLELHSACRKPGGKGRHADSSTPRM